jgi:hypothetical protein
VRASARSLVGAGALAPCTHARLCGSLTGDAEDFSFESYLGFPGEKEAAPAGNIHTVMEARLGMTPGPAPTRPL